MDKFALIVSGMLCGVSTLCEASGLAESSFVL